IALSKVLVAGAETAPIENLSDAVIAAAAAHSGKVTEGYTVTVGGEAAGYAFKVVAGGSQGDIEMIVGVDADNAVTGVSVVNHKETSGIGTKVMGDEPTTSGTGALTQFIGKSGAGSLVVKSNIDAVSGATVSTKGVTKGVNAALAAAEAMG
ncbi:MAG: FMN-binding protein, partial [Oscillospiraceae bacterium]|nr:FMN-binding protein [Oscillospiraceae bacterium]